MSSKTKAVCIAVTPEDLRIIDHLAEDLKLSRSKLLVTAAFFLEGIYGAVKYQGEAKVTAMQELIARNFVKREGESNLYRFPRRRSNG
jgi:hypothetical protein